MSRDKLNNYIPLGLIFFFIGLLILALGGCSGETRPLITPSPDKLTFVFFYTDG